MGFGISKLSAYFSVPKVALTVGVPVTGTLLYHSVKAAAYAGLQCFTEPWKYDTLVKIISLPKAMPELFYQTCRPQVYLAAGSFALTIGAGALTIYLARSKVRPGPQRPLPHKPLPLLPQTELVREIINEIKTKTDSFTTEGLFRLSGSKNTIEAARDAIIQRKDTQVIKTLAPNDLTGLIKELLKTNHLPPLPAATFSESEYSQEGTPLLDREYLQKLSPLHREIVPLLMRNLLVPIANNSGKNLMTEDNLVTSFSRSLFVQPPLPERATTEDLKKLAIDQNAWLFKALLAYYRAKQN